MGRVDLTREIEAALVQGNRSGALLRCDVGIIVKCPQLRRRYLAFDRRQQFLELTRLKHLHNDVAAANELTGNVELREGWPV